MSDFTARLSLPLLAVGQAQKEVTHNEALVVADMLVQSVVEAVAPTSIPAAPVPGQCWIVGSAPSGAWAGKAGHIACWSTGGWRFIAPFEGLAVWVIADSMQARWTGGQWQVGRETAQGYWVSGIRVVGAQQAAIAAPSGGQTIDSEARAAVSLILSALETHGLIAG
jgi:hypothetical protein